jgi:hypothetical protein
MLDGSWLMAQGSWPREARVIVRMTPYSADLLKSAMMLF